MTDKLITDLPIISELTGNEIFPLYNTGGGTYKSSIDKIKDYVKQNIFKGNSSQFVKGDGSLDDTNYLKFNDGRVRVNSDKQAVIVLDTTATMVCCQFKKDGEEKGYVGWLPGYGVALLNYTCDKSLGIKDDGTPHFNGSMLWHSGNGGSGSGLDADLLDGKHADDFNYINVPIHFKVDDEVKEITNEQFVNKLANLGAFNKRYYALFCSWSFADNCILTNIVGVKFNLAGCFIEVYTITPTSDITTIPTNYLIKLTLPQTSSTNSANKKTFLYRHISNISPIWQEIAFTDSNVASSNKLTTKVLSNEDLNDLKAINTEFKTYYATSGNTCLNKPTGITVFQLTIYNASSVPIQILTNHLGNIYKRTCYNDEWSAWTQLATTDGAVAKLTTKQLIDEDLDTIKDINFSNYWADSINTCANKPTNATIFYLQSYRASGWYQQILTTHEGNMYKRTYDAGTTTWTSWKKMLTEDDIAPLVARIEALEARPVVQIADSVPGTPAANTFYAIPEQE